MELRAEVGHKHLNEVLEGGPVLGVIAPAGLHHVVSIKEIKQKTLNNQVQNSYFTIKSSKSRQLLKL